MLFEELNCDTFKVKGESMIYFLLQKGTVVYVGQTKQGILRPLSHKDKQFDTIKILYCGKEELCNLEDKYITKYQPKYNKTFSYSSNYSLIRARNKIREAIGDYHFNLYNLKSVIKELGIEVYNFNFKSHIRQQDFEKIVSFLKEKEAK